MGSSLPGHDQSCWWHGCHQPQWHYCQCCLRTGIGNPLGHLARVVRNRRNFALHSLKVWPGADMQICTIKSRHGIQTARCYPLGRTSLLRDPTFNSTFQGDKKHMNKHKRADAHREKTRTSRHMQVSIISCSGLCVPDRLHHKVLVGPLGI